MGLVPKLLAALAVVAIVVLGIWVTGGLLTNDFTLAMALTVVWMGMAGVACVAIAVGSRALRVPVLAAYVVTALVVGGYLGSSMFLDDEVDEEVVTAAEPAEGRSDRPVVPRNILTAEGRFELLEHEVTGTAKAIERAEGGEVLTLTDFEVDNGPDLRVYLVADELPDVGDPGDFEDLGALKGNKGDQQYEIPRAVDTKRYSTVVVWCRAFSVAFAQAPLEKA